MRLEKVQITIFVCAPTFPSFRGKPCEKKQVSQYFQPGRKKGGLEITLKSIVTWSEGEV